jgi:3-methyladenine DNA glycosylase/8-oxoguanine DNA glycosylase
VIGASLTPDDYVRARRALMRRDPVLGDAIKRIGPCGMAARQQPHHLIALVRAIVGQQLSSKAAATIFARFVALFPADVPLSAGAIAALDDKQLRGVGFERAEVELHARFERAHSRRAADAR